MPKPKLLAAFALFARRFVAVHACSNIINPMIVDGQIHGGLAMGLAPALLEEIVYDENGVNLSGTFMDYLLPTAVVDALAHLGVMHIDIPITPPKVWAVLKEKGVAL